MVEEEIPSRRSLFQTLFFLALVWYESRQCGLSLCLSISCVPLYCQGPRRLFMLSVIQFCISCHCFNLVCIPAQGVQEYYVILALLSLVYDTLQVQLFYLLNGCPSEFGHPVILHF